MVRGFNLISTVFLLICVLGFASQAKADTVVTFTVASGGNFAPTYTEQGFSFTSTQVGIFGNQLHVTNFNTNPSSIVITFAGGAFDFLGFDYTFAGGFSGTAFTASNGAVFIPQFPGVTYTLGPEFRNITSLTLTHFNTFPAEGPTLNAYDNFRFQSPSTAPVPEPASLFLLGIGLAGARIAARRHRKTRRQ